MDWCEVQLCRGIKPTVRKTHDEKCEVEVLNKYVFTLKVDTYTVSVFPYNHNQNHKMQIVYYVNINEYCNIDFGYIS